MGDFQSFWAPAGLQVPTTPTGNTIVAPTPTVEGALAAGAPALDLNLSSMVVIVTTDIEITVNIPNATIQRR